ncbi:putative RNA-directed DNA polymerase [Tanacetum coccineum]
MWSLDHLSVSVPCKGLYKTKPSSPRVIKSLIQISRQGQETRTKNKKTIVVGKNQILTREIQTHMKPWVEIIRENAICLGGHRDHVFACLCHMLYCIETSTPYNLAFFILKRMEKTRFKPKELLPYGMLLTRLFKHVVSISPELAFDHFLSHDPAMHPLAPHYVRKTRADQGKKRPRESNASSSSTTLNHPSSSLPLDLVRRSARIPQAPERYGFYIDAEEHELGDHGEPPNYRAALSDPESKKWLEAMNAEMQSMKDNQVWNLVDLPPNCKTVGSKWLFKKKTDMDGNIHTYKARLVAKGFTQTYGVDYEETFSPVADIKAIRILIAIAAYYDYEIWQMDVKTAFLNGRLNEDVYMVQPEGFVNPKHPRRVCKLQRSIYGLKQASRSWNKRFDEEIKKYGFTQNPDEPCVYKRASGSIIVFLILYVDDILLMGNNIPMLQDVKSWLGKCFAMKDLGEAAYILGIKIYRDRSRRLISLSQNAYIDKILKRFKMDTSKRGTIPMQPNVDLRKSQGPSTPAEVKRMKGIPYASAVGSIIYAVRCTIPDVTFSHNLTSRYQHNPDESHWTAVKNILKYIRNTKDMFLVYGGDSTTELGVTCYTDASWETDRDDLRS